MAITDCKPLPPLSEQDIATFWSKVDKTPGQGPKGDCHRWKGYCSKSGYGELSINRGGFKAHRVALFLHSGKDPFPLFACHTCDWPPCCRGEHLFPGTCADNHADRGKKGRTASGDRHGTYTKPESRARGALNGSRLHPDRLARGERSGARLHPDSVARGERCHSAKLVAEQVIQIRQEHAAGNISYSALARKYDVGFGAIHKAVLRKTWRHIP